MRPQLHILVSANLLIAVSSAHHLVVDNFLNNHFCSLLHELTPAPSTRDLAGSQLNQGHPTLRTCSRP